MTSVQSSTGAMRARTTSAPAPARPVSMGRAWAVTVMVVLLMMINFGDKAVLGLAAAPIMKELGISAAQFGAISSSFFFLFSLSALFVGWLSKRFSTFWILLVLALLWSITATPIIFAASLPMLYLSRISLGAAEGPTSPMTVHAVQKWFPARSRGLPTAMTQIGSALGVAIASPVLGYFIAVHGWRSAFVVLAIAGVVWAAAWLFIGKEGPLETLAAADSGDVAKDAQADVRVSFWKLLFNRTTVGLMLAGIGCYWLVAGGIAWMPSLLEAKGFDFTHAALIAGLPSVVSAASMLIIPPVLDRMVFRGRSQRACYGGGLAVVMVISALCLFLAPALTGGALVAALVIAFGIGGVTFPLTFLVLAQYSPVKSRGALQATTTAVVTFTGVIAPAAIGALLTSAGSMAAGASTVFLVSGVLVAVCTAIGVPLIHPAATIAKLGVKA
ncbi:MFS transporter [Brevibacterium sp. 91QC2O2]|uniref:MFS transporter n=1 Tax=Brevibacterium sp. 91QC2O2 TaxID=2968458 RepID=UPI00211B9BA9|nr:MFS transporter [Brevibacterium sp. 91QC2O2]MCQ9367103.1 MFS transporter [Brevibacterium sp. 91QC2O2]